MLYEIGTEYTRQDIYNILNLPLHDQGGRWLTGCHKHGNIYYIFSNIGFVHSTGYSYDNRWEGDKLIWFGTKQSHFKQPIIKNLISDEYEVLVFHRSGPTDPFTFAGKGMPIPHLDTSMPVRIDWIFPESDLLDSSEFSTATERAKRKVNAEPEESFKLCKSCNLTMPPQQFKPSKDHDDSLTDLCRDCLSNEVEERSKKEFKLCKKCNLTLPVQQFYSSKRNDDGLSKLCRDCLYQDIKKPSKEKSFSISHSNKSNTGPNRHIKPTKENRNSFRVLQKYSKENIFQILKVDRRQIPILDKATCVKYRRCWYIFANLTKEGNALNKDVFHWTVGAQRQLQNSTMDEFKDENTSKLLFLREKKEGLFTYMGYMKAVSIKPTVPQHIVWRLMQLDGYQRTSGPSIKPSRVHLNSKYDELQNQFVLQTYSEASKAPPNSDENHKRNTKQNTHTCNVATQEKRHQCPLCGRPRPISEFRLAPLTHRPTGPCSLCQKARLMNESFRKVSAVIARRFSVCEMPHVYAPLDLDIEGLKLLLNENEKLFILLENWYVPKSLLEDRLELWDGIQEILDTKLAAYDVVFFSFLLKELQSKRVLLSEKTPWHPSLLDYFLQKYNHAGKYALLGCGRTPSCIASARDPDSLQFEEILHSILLQEKRQESSKQEFMRFLLESGVIHKENQLVLGKVYQRFYSGEPHRKISYSPLESLQMETYWNTKLEGSNQSELPEVDHQFYEQFL